MVKKVAVIDFGMGNLYSVTNALRTLRVPVDIVASARNFSKYTHVILPGVGAFGDAARELKKRKLAKVLKEYALEGRSFLGICLGMQLLMDSSEESRGTKGLGIIPGMVKRFSKRLKCPHMGWNQVEKKFNDSIFMKVGMKPYAYFCHSYYAVPEDRAKILGITHYGTMFPSVIKHGRVYGVQFHPEKSQDDGLMMLNNFINKC